MNARHRFDALLKLSFVGLLAFLMTVTPCRAEAEGVVAFEEGFDAAPSEAWSHSTTDTAPATGEKFLGRFGEETVTLSLEDLPEHGWVRLSFDVYVID